MISSSSSALGHLRRDQDGRGAADGANRWRSPGRPEAEELINHAMCILRGHMTVDDVIDPLTVFATLSEAIKYAALSFRTDIERRFCDI